MPQRRTEHFPGPWIVGSLLLFFFVLLGSSSAADDTCIIQAAANKLRGKELVSFMVDCKALMELICNDRARDQGLNDEIKERFIRKCVKDSVGR